MDYMFLPLKKFADFEGRSRRKEYWMFFLFVLLVVFILGLLDFMISPGGIGIIALIFQLGVLVPSIAVAIRRMHDVGKSGWFILIPIYNLILAVSDGEKGTNQYGPDPKGSADEIGSIGKEELV